MNKKRSGKTVDEDMKKTIKSRKNTAAGQFSHIDKSGNVIMVDISGKEISERKAIASGSITLTGEIIKKLNDNSLGKGNALAAAKIAGIMAAKNTAYMIPLCHQIKLSTVDIQFEIKNTRNKLICRAEVKGLDKTGVEMEALSAVAVSLLTIYDMCKSMSKDMVIGEIKLIEKTKKLV